MADMFDPATAKLESDFRTTWQQLARQGRVDGLGGVEYTRVLGEWRSAGRPASILGFIIPAANRIPPPALPPGGLTFIPPQP